VESIIPKNYKPKKRFTVTFPEPQNTIVEILVDDIYMGRIANDYCGACQNDKLFFWGYPNKFARLYNPYINQVGKAAVAEYLKIK